MKNTSLPFPFPSPSQQLIGMPAEKVSDRHVPDSNHVVGNIKLQAQLRKNRGILTPEIPFRVRNNEPNLQEFLIY